MDNFENLLNLHGEVFPMDNGYWIKFEVHQVERTKGCLAMTTLIVLNQAKNMLPIKRRMIIFIKRLRLLHTNLNQPINYSKTFGLV